MGAHETVTFDDAYTQIEVTCLRVVLKTIIFNGQNLNDQDKVINIYASHEFSRSDMEDNEESFDDIHEIWARSVGSGIMTGDNRNRASQLNFNSLCQHFSIVVLAYLTVSKRFIIKTVLHFVSGIGVLEIGGHYSRFIFFDLDAFGLSYY